jgi:membrane protease YdiL (CAAX protease family)
MAMSVRRAAPTGRVGFDNPWIVGVDQASRALPAWFVLLAGLAAAAAVVGLARALSPWTRQVSARAPEGLGDVLAVALLYAAMYLPLFVASALGGRLEGRRVWRIETHPGRAAAGGLALGAGGLCVAVATAAAAGSVQPGQGASGAGVLAGPLVGLFFFAWQSAGEEYLFRGWMQPVLCARLGPAVGLVTTATAFSLLHLLAGAHRPVAVLNLILGGLMFGLIALRSGGLICAIAAHGAWNWTEACGLGLAPNPGVGPFGTLLDLDLVGRPLWSGGSDALNGSLATTLVLVAVTGLLLRPRRDGR